MLPRTPPRPLLGSLLLTVACSPAALQPGKPVHEFPTPSNLTAIAQSAQAGPAPQLEFESGGEWEVDPHAAGASPEQASASALAPEVAARLGAQPSAALDCVA